MALVDGIADTLTAEISDVTLGGDEHAANVLMCLFADCLDAADALEA